jgi:hypothetical protein
MNPLRRLTHLFIPEQTRADPDDPRQPRAADSYQPKHVLHSGEAAPATSETDVEARVEIGGGAGSAPGKHARQPGPEQQTL